MRIIFFINGLLSGGKERRLTELMKGLKGSHDIDYELVVMGPHIHYKEIFDLNIKIHYLIRKKKKMHLFLRGFMRFVEITGRI